MDDGQFSGIESADDQNGSLLDKCIRALFEKDRLNHLGCFVQGLIHNINGPLHNMSMLVEVLIRGQDQLETYCRINPAAGNAEWAALVEKQGKRLHQMNQQIGALADMLRSFMVLHEIERNDSEVDLNLVLTRLSEAFRADLFYKHQINLDLRLTRNLPLVRILGRHLIPALVHLLRNAIMAMGTSPEKRLTIESRLDEGRIWIVLRDTGSGFPSDKGAECCFDLFYSNWPVDELPQANAEPPLGFGLYAARQLLKPYGIEVILEREGEETKAVVKIPLASRDE